MESKATETAATEETQKKPRGFAGMAKDRLSEISSLGGKRAHEMGVAHRWTSEAAKAAGIKGGKALHARRGRGRGNKSAA